MTLDKLIKLLNGAPEPETHYLYKLTKLHAERPNDENTHISSYPKQMFKSELKSLIRGRKPDIGERNYLYYFGLPIYLLLLNNELI